MEIIAKASFLYKDSMSEAHYLFVFAETSVFHEMSAENDHFYENPENWHRIGGGRTSCLVVPYYSSRARLYESLEIIHARAPR